MPPRAEGATREAIRMKDDLIKAASSVFKTNAGKKGSGGEGSGGVYGAVNHTDMVDIIVALVEGTGFSKHSTFVDAGHGLFQPGILAFLAVGTYRLVGFECDFAKHQKSLGFVANVFADLKAGGHLPATTVLPTVYLHRGSARWMASDLHGGTHLYTFWQGWSDRDKWELGRLWRESHTLQGLVIVDETTKAFHKKMEQTFGFGPLKLVAELPVRMEAGSAKCAYIFRRGRCMTDEEQDEEEEDEDEEQDEEQDEEEEEEAAVDFSQQEAEEAAAVVAEAEKMAAAAANPHGYGTRSTKYVPGMDTPVPGQTRLRRLHEKFVPVYGMEERFEVNELACVRAIARAGGGPPKALRTKLHNPGTADPFAVDLYDGRVKDGTKVPDRRKVPLARLMAVTFAAQLPGCSGLTPPAVMRMLGMDASYKSTAGHNRPQPAWRIHYVDGERSNCRLSNLLLVPNEAAGQRSVKKARVLQP